MLMFSSCVTLVPQVIDDWLIKTPTALLGRAEVSRAGGSQAWGLRVRLPGGKRKKKEPRGRRVVSARPRGSWIGAAQVQHGQ